MSEQEGPRNRKERRAAARENGQKMEPPTSAPKIKLAQPDRSGPTAKTLFQIVEERKELLEKGQPFDKKYEDGLARDEEGNPLLQGPGDEPIGPVGDAIFLAICLGMMHFTLDVLVYNQYSQETDWRAIFVRSGKMLPVLFVLIYALRSQTAKKLPDTVRQAFFFAVAVAAGCHMIYVGNTFDYFAVMKRAPPVGTLWVWSVIEMQLPWAVVSVVIDVGYLWLNGYTAF